MSKKISISLLALFSLTIASFSQSADFYKQKALECLTNNDCGRAQIMYDSYKELSKQKDLTIEASIKKCFDNKTVPVESKVVETILKLSEINLSFNYTGEPEKSKNQCPSHQTLHGASD